MGRFDPPSKQDAIQAERLERAIDCFRGLNPAMPSSYMRAFLAVARRPGHGSSEYAAELQQAQAVASRILLELGQKTRTGGPGLGLLDSDKDPVDPRFKRTFLTPKGRALFEHIMKAIGNT